MPEVKAKDVVIGLIVLVILITGALYIRNSRRANTSSPPISTPNISQVVKNTFPNIPEGVERVNLSDVSGGNSIGVATRTEIVANLPELGSGKFYQVLLSNSSGKTLVLGNMKISKSGYILEYSSNRYPDYNKVMVIQGSTRILEGSF